MTQLRVFLCRFLSDRRGSYAIIFAIAIVPLLVAIGAAIDISQAYVVKQRMTKALDAAGLAVGGTTGLSTAQLQAMAQDFFDANYPATKMGIPGTVSVTQSGQVVSLSVAASMPTTIMGIVGIDMMNIAASSQITKMGKKLEVVLVLDTTGSMLGNSKLSTMKTAAKNLIATVSAAAATPGDVKVSIVPFAVDVKVGTANKTADWLKWTWTTTKSMSSVKDCKLMQGGPTWSCTLQQNSWLGCVIDRDQDFDISNSAPVVGNAATLHPVDNADCKPVELMPLSYDWAALNSKIDSLKASGNTNTPIGLVWGWNMLTPGAPLSAAAAPDPKKLNKAIVFLTDGDNTENRFTTVQSKIDARMSALCTAVKAQNIQIYMIRVMNGNEALLKPCATDPSMYFRVTSASQLTEVFNSIAQALSNLRISH